MALPPKDITWWTERGCLFDKAWANCWILRSLPDGQETDVHCIPPQSLKRKLLHEMECNLRQTKRAPKGSGSLSSMFRVSQDHDIIQTNNNMKILVMAREQYGFMEWGENPRYSSQPKWQNLPLIRFVVPKNGKTDGYLDNRNINKHPWDQWKNNIIFMLNKLPYLYDGHFRSGYVIKPLNCLALSLGHKPPVYLGTSNVLE